MAEPEPIGLAVVGVSGIARNCLAAARAAGSGLALRAVCATDGGPLARAAGEFEVPFATGEFREVLDRPDVDAVAIYTPDPLHFPMIRDALLAGKDVVVTKPMVVSSEESAQVLALLRQTGRTLLVGETSRFDRRTLAARRLLEDGDLGRLTFGETHYVHDMRPVFDRTPWRYQEPHPKDFPIGSMCHPISLITSFFGDVEELHAYGIHSGVDQRYPAHRQDTFIAVLKFREGGIGRVLGAFGIVEPPLPMESLSLFGTKGSLVNNDLVLDRLPGHPRLRLEYRGETGHGGQVQRYMQEFVRCLRDGAASTSTALDGAKTVAVGEAIKESVRTGRPVQPRRTL
ncbi:MAG TPA: Gfo/Idh/MocA family oxidoreductase [Chloroflexota bacterium]|nr:Gfo/Idh/MocA family oxidoreductase [Chloroflexota bacterium]